MNIFSKLINWSINKFKKAVATAVEENISNPFLQFKKDIDELIDKHDFITIVKFFFKLCGVVSENTGNGLQKAEDFIDKKIAEIKKKIAKKIAQVLKKIMKVVIKAIFKILSKIVMILWPWGFIIILVIVLIVLFISLWPALSNLFSFSYGFNKADYYDTELFQAVKNKETMLENVYERTADTSYYQRFADSEIDDFLGLLVPNLEDEQTKYGKTYKEAAQDAQGGFTGFYTMDERTTAHDANFNPMQDIIQANTIDTSNENKSTMQGFFRDLFDKEVNFALSEQFLRQANTYVQEMGNNYNVQLVYPEMFTKPLAYVVDFNRIDQFTEPKENKLQYLWKDYTYTTKRVLQEDINQSLGNVVRNVRELDWAANYGESVSEGTILKDSDQGLICSWPSPYVWEYAVYKKDYYQLYDDGTDSGVINSRDNMVDNDYNSEYLTVINDETGEVEQVKFFYEMLGASGEDTWTTSIDRTAINYNPSWWESLTGSLIAWLKGNPDDSPISKASLEVNSYGFLGDGANYTFDGPYVGVLDKTYSSSPDGSPIEFFTKVSDDDIWYTVNIPEGYRLPSDIAAITIDENGVEHKNVRTKDSIKIRKDFNKGPTRHIQTVELSDKNGNLAVSSQNLINYKYYKIKTVSEAYRNGEEYINGWGDWINTNFEELSSFADRDLTTSVARRISSVGKSAFSVITNAFKTEQTDLGDYTLAKEDEGTLDDLMVTGEQENEAAIFNIIMDFPPETLALSLYLYEKDLVENKPENETWVWNYSVNNYFKTDNKKMDGYEFYQKYYYLYEEATIGGLFSEVAEDALEEYNVGKINLFGEYDSSDFINQIITTFQNEGTLNVYTTNEQNVENIVLEILQSYTIKGIFKNAKSIFYQITNKQVDQKDFKDLLEKISGKMHTSYINLGTIRMSNEPDKIVEGFAEYKPNYNTITSSDKQTVIGVDISGMERGGEASLLSTFAINDAIREEALIYSARNNGGGIELSDKPGNLTFKTDTDKIATTWTNIKNWFAFLGDSGYTEEPVPEHIFNFNISGEEHDHYQYEYYIDEGCATYNSGVFDNSGNGMENQLPLEVQSVRDYGLGSILNYVDSITVEFYSGAWYDEVYLKQQIGEAVTQEYADVYSTYSYSNKNNFDRTGNHAILDASKTTEKSFTNASAIVGSGYYPKEMKDEASDFIVELFEQNNKKKLFEQLLNSIDGKIFEVQDAYDVALWDEEKEGKLDIDGVKYDLTDLYTLDQDLQEVSFPVDVVTDSLIGIPTHFTLLNQKKNPIVCREDVDWNAYQIYEISKTDSKFYYYMPEIVYASDRGVPSKVAQLLIPKRYYRSWVRSLSYVEENGEEYDERIEKGEISQLEMLMTLILKRKIKDEQFLKTYDDTLPTSNLDAIKKGISDKISYSVGIDGTGTENGEYNYYAGKDSSLFGSDDFNPWKMAKLNKDVSRILSENASTIDTDGKTWYYNSNGETQETKPSNGKLYDDKGKEILTSNEEGEENYYKALLDMYSSKNFKTGINKFEFITDDDVEKVFVIDEVATFTGKFMYTYKDTLLSTGDILDFNHTKGILSAYATDRYIFLDSWDIKLLTERIIDVSFMFMNVEPTVDGKCIPQYIKERNEELADSFVPTGNLLADTINSIKSAIKNFLAGLLTATKVKWAEESFDNFYSNVYVYAVPAKYAKNLNIDSWESGSDAREEIEAYTKTIFTGFLFQNSSPKGSLFISNSGSFDGNPWEQTFDLLHDKAKYELDQEAIDAVSSSCGDVSGIIDMDSFNENLKTYSESRYISSAEVATIKQTLQKITNSTNASELSDIITGGDSSAFPDFLTSRKLTIHIETSEMFDAYNDYIDNGVSEEDAFACLKAQYLDFINYCTVYIYANGEKFEGYTYSYLPETTSPGLFESAKNALNNITSYVSQILSKAITGFEITSEEYSLCTKFDCSAFAVSDASDGTEGYNNYKELVTSTLTGLENDYVKIMGYSESGEISFEGFDYDYTIKLNDSSTESGVGKAICHAFIETYTLKCSDEIANKVVNGRYYSMFSPFGVGIEADINHSYDAIKKMDDFVVFEDWEKNSLFQNTTAYGELLTVHSEDLKKDLEEIYTKDSNTLKVSINNTNGTKNVILDYDKLWQPEVKLFDNLDNIEYINETKKETLYGCYITNDGKNNPNINVSENVLDKIKQKQLSLTKVTNDNASKSELPWFLRYLGQFMTNRKFLERTFDRNVPDSLIGFELDERRESPLFAPEEKTNKEEGVFFDKKEDINLISKGYAVNPISLLNDAQLKEVLLKLNNKYGSKLKTLLNQGSYAVDIGTLRYDRHTEDYAITGFVLVPRFSDRRDEPTLYPTYRYYGGSKKQIIPQEQVKYFEGLTYDSWKAKMTINEESDEEDTLSFKEEMHRLSNYIYTYFSNFEAYVPYNIITDSDLEVRGTAGYADLLTQYTLYPVRTKAYTKDFVTEANKSYWNDLCEAYDIPRTVIAQLLQGIAETRLSAIGEDSVALLIKQGDLSEYSEEAVAAINVKVTSMLRNDGSFENTEVVIDGKSVKLPILGVCAIDNIPDKELGDNPEETETTHNIKSFADVVFIGSVSDEAASALEGTFAQVINTSNVEASELLGRISEIPEDAKAVAVMPSVQDVLNTRNDVGNIDTMNVRKLLKSVTKRVPEAEVYYLPINPVVATQDGGGFAPEAPWEGPDIVNNAIASFNERIDNFCENNLDGKVEYKDALSSIADDATGGLEKAYADSDLYSLNSYGMNTLIRYLKNAIFEEDADESLVFKDTRYFSPISSNLKDFETALNITEEIGDDRLDVQKSISYMSLRLYKNSKSLGDLLKGVYASFYGEKFVKALIAVTDDNSINLAIDNQHGLWYRPTDNDIIRALDRLNDKAKQYFDWKENVPHDELREVYGILKLQKSFSYIKDMDYRKILVTYAMNSAGGLGNIAGINIADLDWEIGTKADAVKPAAEQIINGTSLINGKSINGVRMIDYIATICNEFSNEEVALDPALVMALIYHESHGIVDIKQYGGGLGRGLAQHSVPGPGGLSASATTNAGNVVSINFPYDKATDPIASIDYIVMNFAGALQAADYEMHPFTALKTHNLPTTLTARKEFYSEYSKTAEGDLQYIYDYETGKNYQGYKRTMELSGDEAAYAARQSQKSYEDGIPRGENFGYSDPQYITHILAYYCEEYANGDLLNSTLGASNKRDYSEEIWEEEYLKYQNSGVTLYSGNVSTTDIDQLVEMTAIYRNNNDEQNEYGYTYLDFFRNIDKNNAGENEFTGEMGEALVLNAMTYLGAHYSQGLASRPQDKISGILYKRNSHAENMGGSVYNTPWGQNYEEGTFADGNKYAFDCSSFGTQMYIAMGYNLEANTCATLNSKYGGDSEIYLGQASSVGVENLQPGDLLVSSSHTIIWAGQTYTANYGDLFDPTTLRIIGNQIVKRSGNEVLSWANANVSKNAYIHCGGYKPGGSCVNLKEASNSYLSRFAVYRFFRDDIDYNQGALSGASANLCPTIFTKTTIKNNPYLVQYMEDSGILEAEMAKGQFTNEDVINAKNKISSVNGETETEEEADEFDETAIGASRKDTGYYVQ